MSHRIKSLLIALAVTGAVGGGAAAIASAATSSSSTSSSAGTPTNAHYPATPRPGARSGGGSHHCPGM